MIPPAEQVGEGGGGGQAGGEGDGVLRAVDGGQALLEDVAGGVAAAAVLESIGERLLVHYEVHCNRGLRRKLPNSLVFTP